MEALPQSMSTMGIPRCGRQVTTWMFAWFRAFPPCDHPPRCGMPFTANIVVRDPCKLGEGPRWSQRERCLWWIDIVGRRILRWDPASGDLKTWPVPGDIGMLAEREQGGLLVALRDGLYDFDPVSGVCTALGASHDQDVAQFRFNDGACDAAGRLWVGTIGPKSKAHFYRFAPGLGRTLIRDDITCSNGIAWSPDGATMYYIDTPTRQVMAYPFDSGSGALGDGRVAISVPEDRGHPDGCCMDAEGMLWIGLWGGGGLLRCNPADGSIIDTVTVPGARNVTACSFGGPNLDVLYITTAGGGEAGQPENAGFLFAVEPGVHGLPWHAFAG
jgi:sugar lactone lactonase YvrE